MEIIFKGFNNKPLQRDLEKIITTQPLSISKFALNIADIEIEEGNFIITKKGARDA